MMTDTMPMMDEAPPAAPMPASAEDRVPVAALAMPDENEQMTEPEVGDKVSYTIEGTVSRVEGANAWVKRETVNGQPVDTGPAKPETPPENEPGGDELASLEDEAKKVSF